MLYIVKHFFAEKCIPSKEMALEKHVKYNF